MQVSLCQVFVVANILQISEQYISQLVSDLRIYMTFLIVSIGMSGPHNIPQMLCYEHAHGRAITVVLDMLRFSHSAWQFCVSEHDLYAGAS